MLGYVIQEVMLPASALTSMNAVQAKRAEKEPRQITRRRARWYRVTGKASDGRLAGASASRP